MAIYKHEKCEGCKHIGIDTLHEKPADIYYCKNEEPYPTIIVRTGDLPHQYSSVDVKTLMSVAKSPGTKTLELMVKYLKKLTLEEAMIL